MTNATEDDILAKTEDWIDDPERAIRMLTDFINEHPQNLRVRLRLAQIFAAGYGEGVDAAERMYREILEVEPSNIFALSQLGLLHGTPGSDMKLTESISLLGKAAQISGEPWALENLGNKAWESSLYDLALAAFDRLRDVASKRKQYHLVDVANRSAKSVRRKQGPKGLHYSVPWDS